jgi:hypothetical protein
MKNILIVSLFLMLIILLNAQTTSSPTSFTSKTDYATIINGLLKQVEAGKENADLYYNIGVCYFELGHTGKAVLWFLRAQNLNSNHHQAKDNLEFLDRLHQSDQKTLSRPFLTVLFLNIYDFFTLNRLAITVLILSFLFTLCLLWLLFYPEDKERGLPILTLSIVFVLLLVFSVTLIVKNDRYIHNTKAVVMQEGTALFASPGSVSQIQVLSEGTIVQIRQSGKEMDTVVLQDGTGGWIKKSQLERVVPRNKASLSNRDISRSP